MRPRIAAIAFTKVKYPWGWLSNMSPHSVEYQGLRFKTTEHLFQWLRFSSVPAVQQLIFEQKSPMGAKMVCKPFARGSSNLLPVPLCDADDLARMELCLRLKLEQHPELRHELSRSGSLPIIEDCGRRKDLEIDSKSYGNGLPFWGARWDVPQQSWLGTNALGNLWMKLRAECVVACVNPPMFIGHLHPHKLSSTLQKRKMQLVGTFFEINQLVQLETDISAIFRKVGICDLAEYQSLLKRHCAN